MKRKIHLFFLILCTILCSNFLLLAHLSTAVMPFFLWFPLGVLILTIWCFFQIMPHPRNSQVSVRLTIMIGGRRLCYSALLGLLIQLLITGTVYPHLPVLVTPKILWINTIIASLVYFFMLWNGILRIFFTSARLRISTRLLMLLYMWIPVVNLFVLLYALRKVHEEYDHGRYQSSLRLIRADSDLCSTSYPILMIHGVGFRDLRYFNYWGRIPRELTRYGATIYYGNQEAFGTITYNAEDIKKKIQEIRTETGAEKVNIIAHSKGGLDSRYAISQLGMDQYVASLTTMNTPHHGCRFVDYACKLPDPFYHFVARQFDRMFYRFGDENPDFYTATRQFSTISSRDFNKNVPDSPLVYYQSYTTVMKYFFSHLLLSIPYCLIYPLEGNNDGLVSIESAKWGTFKGVISNRHWRGISHGDIIDLKREDYKGFDVIECYVQIVSELKDMGF